MRLTPTQGGTKGWRVGARGRGTRQWGRGQQRCEAGVELVGMGLTVLVVSETWSSNADLVSA